MVKSLGFCVAEATATDSGEHCLQHGDAIALATVVDDGAPDGVPGMLETTNLGGISMDIHLLLLRLLDYEFISRLLDYDFITGWDIHLLLIWVNYNELTTSEPWKS